MTFATEQVKRATKKIILARITPARDITPIVKDQLAPDNIWEFPFTYELASLQQNSTVFTQVAVGATLINNQYYYDRSIGQVSFKTATAPSGSNVIVATYHLFYTDSNYIEARITPTNSGLTELVPWEPRISSISSIGEDLTNALYGVLSISGGNLTLVNTDHNFNQYLSDDDSFRFRPITIWQALKDAETVSNVQQLFQGRVDSIEVNGHSANISYSTEIGRLKESATMGDSVEDIYFNKSGFPNVNPAQEGLPVRFMFGSITKYKHVASGTVVSGELVDPSTMYEAVNISYSTTISTSTNRTWGLCRVGPYGTENFSNAIAGVDNTNPGNTKLQINYAQPNEGQYWHGMTFTISGGGLPTYKVLGVDKFSAYTHYVYVTKDATLTTSDSIVTNDCPSLYFYRAEIDTYYPLDYSTHYTATTTTTAGGNKFVKITLVNNFEALIDPIPAPLNPETDKLFFRVLPGRGTDQNQRHGSVIKQMLEKAGLAVESASITSANSLLPTNANFSIPMFDENDYGNYFDYVQKILASSLGIITQNLSGQMRYTLITKPISSVSTITDNDIIEESLAIGIEYNDVVESIVTYNPNFSDTENDGDSSVSMTSTRAKYLHNTGNVLTFRNVLESMTDPITRMLGIRAERYADYNFETKQVNYLSTIGQNYNLSKNGLLGTDSSRIVKILSLNKSKNKTKIKSTDLFNMQTII